MKILNSALIILSILTTTFTAQADQCEWNDQAIASRMTKIIERLAGTYDKNPSIYFMCENCSQYNANRSDLGIVRYYIKKTKDFEVDKGAVKYKFADINFRREAKVNKDYREVELTLQNGVTVDIDGAYMYLETAPNVYVNLAYLVDCETQGVSPRIIANGSVKQSEGLEEVSK